MPLFDPFYFHAYYCYDCFRVVEIWKGDSEKQEPWKMLCLALKAQNETVSHAP